MTTYELITLTPSGDTCAVKTTTDGRVFGSIALAYDEIPDDLTDMHYEDEWNSDAYDNDIAGRPVDDDSDTYGSSYYVIRSQTA